MKFNEFYKLYKKSPFIDSSTFGQHGSITDIRRQVSGWQQKGYLAELKRGLYIFSDEYRVAAPNAAFYANLLAVPSYLSLEYALGAYGMIPERVTVITSVTTRKTAKFRNVLGVFEYRSIKKELFFGYKKIQHQGVSVFMACPEKALLDYLYFHTEAVSDPGYFESLRLQNLDILDNSVFESYGKRFNARVANTTSALIAYAREYTGGMKTL